MTSQETSSELARRSLSAPPEKPILTISELIRSQLTGKGGALDRYDSFLWRIRTGYVLVVYGSIGLFTGTQRGISFAGTAENQASLLAILFSIIGFSVCAIVLDAGFIVAKLRVVNDYN